MSDCFVYALLDPRTKKIRYVGMTSMGMKRPKQHWEPYYLKLDGRTHKTNWIRSLLCRGLIPEIFVLEHVSTRDEALLAEQSWIWFLKSSGAPLTNRSLGGDGTVGYRHTEEAKERIGAPKRGKPRSPEVRAKLSASHLARGKTQEELEHMAALGRSWKGKKRSAETRAKMSAAKTGKKRPPEMVERVAEQLRGRKHSEESLRKMSEAQRGKKKSPETRARMAEAKRRWWAEKREQEAA